MEYYSATQVEGLIKHLANGVNKHMPIAKDYVNNVIEQHTLEVTRIND